MTVRLTWTTMVTYWSVKLLIIWLRNISMQVGRVTWTFTCKKCINFWGKNRLQLLAELVKLFY